MLVLRYGPTGLITGSLLLAPCFLHPASQLPAPCSLLPACARLAVLSPEASSGPGFSPGQNGLKPVLSLLSPEARSGALQEAGMQGSREAGKQGSRVVPCQVGVVGYPRGVTLWGTPLGYTTPVHRCCRHLYRRCSAGTAQEQGPGLKAARRVRVGGSQTGEAGLTLLYLRSFPPGTQIRPKAGSGNGWIGSRSRPARGRSDVQDLVGL